MNLIFPLIMLGVGLLALTIALVAYHIRQSRRKRLLDPKRDHFYHKKPRGGGNKKAKTPVLKRTGIFHPDRT